MFRRRREKLQAHLKESRSLKNYTTSSHNALEAKMRASNTNLQIHEVSTWDVFSLLFFLVLIHVNTWKTDLMQNSWCSCFVKTVGSFSHVHCNLEFFYRSNIGLQDRIMQMALASWTSANLKTDHHLKQYILLFTYLLTFSYGFMKE